MKLSKSVLAVLGTAALVSGLLSQSAQAVPINGSIGFNGSGFGSTAGGTSTLTFNNPLSVDARIGDYAGIAPGTTANFAPISFTGSGNTAVLTSNNSPQWTLVSGGTTYSFNLLSLTSATLTTTTVALSGQGIATISGAINRDPTFASFSVQGTGNAFTFTIIQSSTSASGQQVGVPDGGSAIALLGVGLIALEVMRRKLLAA